MSSQTQNRLSPARSLSVAVFIAMVSTLTLSFFIFRAISLHLERKRFDPVYDRLDQLQLESAVRIRDSKGLEELGAYLAHLDQVSGARHYLLNSQGIDVLSGEDRKTLLPPPPAQEWRIRTEGHSVAAQQSTDGQYWFAAEGGRTSPWLWAYLPYYFLVAGATALLCWLASMVVISPVRDIAISIAQFGRGDLSARVHSTRRDEIGQLASSFNRMADQLERKIVAERTLLADVSHELRSPLARLKFAVRLARTSSDSESALDRIDRDVDRITSLVSGIIEAASAEGDFDDRRLETVHVGNLLDEVMRDCAMEAEVRHCRIALHGRHDVEVSGIRELLRRAVENVLRNGIRYSPEWSVVDVSSNVAPKSVEIAIRDYGPGVPDELLTRIFDPFFRGKEAAGSTGGGSGLGLSIAKRAVLIHSGAIAAKNAAPGLCVRITIPRSAGPEGQWWSN
jgi:signal transduction histidine kinase